MVDGQLRTMNRQEMITDFQHFLDTHKEEVEAHLSEPQLEWFEDDGRGDLVDCKRSKEPKKEKKHE